MLWFTSRHLIALLSDDLAYERERNRELRERCDALTEALSQKAGTPITFPRRDIVPEPPTGWWDTKSVAPPTESGRMSKKEKPQ